jgi:hypothetical protein
MRRRATTPAKYEHIDFVPPTEVAEAAAKGLEYRRKATPSNRGGLTPAEASKEGIGSGVQRAVNLKNRDTISPEILKKMRGFFSRHEKNKSIASENKDTPWNDKGYVSWLLWGGDPAKKWADQVLQKMEEADQKEVKTARFQRIQMKREAAAQLRGKWDVYRPLSEIDPGTQDLLDAPTPAWLDRDYPYVTPPGHQGTLKELDYLMSLVPLRDHYRAFLEETDTDMVTTFLLLAEELGVPVDPEVLQEEASEAAVLITKLKWLYNRPRPEQVAQESGIDFAPMSSNTAHTPAYPSGHAIQGYLLASQLSGIAPQHRAAFMDLAHRCAWGRVVAGHHWPSDIVFGKDIYQHIVHWQMPAAIRVASRYEKESTLSESEREEREDERLIRPSPKAKPPRKDLERGRVETDRPDDPDDKQDQKDRSNNYKDAALRVMCRYAEAAAEKVTVRRKKDKKIVVVNRDTLKSEGGAYEELDGDADPASEEGADTSSDTGDSGANGPESTDLSPAQRAGEAAGAKKEREALMAGSPSSWDMAAIKDTVRKEFMAMSGVDTKKLEKFLSRKLKVDPNDDSYSRTSPEEDFVDDLVKDIERENGTAVRDFRSETKQVEKDLQQKLEKLAPSQARSLRELGTSQMAEVVAQLEAAQEEVLETVQWDEARQQTRIRAQSANKVLEKIDSDKPPSPKEIATAIATIRAAEVLDDPSMLNPARPLDALSTTPLETGEGGEAAYRDQMAEESLGAMRAYRGFSADDRQTHRKKLEESLKDMDAHGGADSEKYAATLSQMRGLMIATALEGEAGEGGVDKSFQMMLKGADKIGKLDSFVKLNVTGAAEGDGNAQAAFREVLSDLDAGQMLEMVPEDHPARFALEALQDETTASHMSSEAREKLLVHVQDAIMGDVLFTDNSLLGNGNPVQLEKRTVEPVSHTNPFLAFLTTFMEEQGIKLASSSAAPHYDFSPWGDISLGVPG